MSFQAYCYKCEKSVSAYSILPEKEFWAAIKDDMDVEIMHIGDDGDHIWKLNEHEKKKLCRDKTSGII